METSTRKCAMCAEDIPLAAKICNYCGAQFDLIRRGYCQNCHKIREADEYNHCKVCGNVVVDSRVESRLIEVVTPELSKTKKSRLPIRMIVGVLGLAVIGAAIWFGWNRIPASPAPAITLPATRMFTPTAPVTSSVTPTQTPRPIPTATRPPAWVANFADPILAAIANRPPDFQDNFDDNSGGWRQLEINPCGQRIQVLDGELVFTDCRGNRSNMAYPDFVLELDARFLPETKSNQAVWYVQFRDEIYFLSVNTHGLIYFVTNGKERTDLEIPYVAKSGQNSNQLLLIAKDEQIAFYLNGAPFYHTNNASYTTQKRIVIGCWGESPTNLDRPCVVAFDNFKIWDISDLP